MEKKELRITYQQYRQTDELPAEDQELLAAAKSVLPKAYAPYSNFQVGCAVRLANGEIVAATNQENAAYGLCLCAEQNALGEVGSNHSDQRIEALAVTVEYQHKHVGHPISPCGSCRQVISEFEGRQQRPIRIILRGMSGPILIFESIQLLLPLSFGRADLKGSSRS